MFKITFTCLLINSVALCLANEVLWETIYNSFKERKIGDNITAEPSETTTTEGYSNFVSPAVDKITFNRTHFLEEITSKIKKDDLYAWEIVLHNILNNLISIDDDMPTSVCNTEKNIEASVFSTYVQIWIQTVITHNKDKLSNVNITKTQKISGVLNQTEISEMKFTDIVIKGLENILLHKYNLNVCTNLTEIEMEVPNNLEISGSYTLNGYTDGHSVIGNGSIHMEINWLHIYYRSNMYCDLIFSTEHQCILTEMDSASTLNAKSINVNITGINYREFDEKVINDEINKYFTNHITNQGSSDLNDLMNILNQKLNEHMPAEIIKFIRKMLYFYSYY